MVTHEVHSGNESLDSVIQGLRLGDNVVWQIEDLDDYRFFARPFVARAIQDGFPCIYVRFAPHPPIVCPQLGLEIVEVDPSPGFDYFSAEVHRIIEKNGLRYFYVFDNLSALVNEWATDELLANFFQVTCPFLFELDTVAYFALILGNHDDRTVARIRDTTQLLVNVYRAKDNLYFHALKVWDRYSSQMFLPHAIVQEELIPVFQSGQAAEVTSSSRKYPLRAGADSIAPWESLYRKLLQYQNDSVVDLDAKPEVAILKNEFAQMLLGNHPEFSKLVDRYLSLTDLFEIRKRIVGSGRIGGKAAGMLLARSILLRAGSNIPFQNILEDHDSFYIGSDVFFTFLVNNDFFRLRLQLTRDESMTHEEFTELETRFMLGTFPRNIMEQFRNMLEYFGQAPIIVRSSSLLEDSFGNAFAGKYLSVFCSNQGTPEQRMESFLNAVKRVYASALNPDALAYRRKRGLDDRDEQMALLVQRVSGMSYKNYFFPSLAGVAFSRNLYVWTDRIDPKKGIIRLVFGLGTRAVDRTGGDYPRMISVSHPQLRPEVGDRVVKYSQREIDLIDLSENKFDTRSMTEVICGCDYPNLHLFVSLLNEGHLSDPVSLLFEGEAEDMVVTFNNLIQRTNFVEIIGEMLRILEEAYAQPIDTEFTAFVNHSLQIRLNLVQCRPMGLPGTDGDSIALPENIPNDRCLFRSNRIVSGGIVSTIRYIIFIPPMAYAGIENLDFKKSIARIVGAVNAAPAIREGKCIMMGPGRWGSSNIDLGVGVHYSDINNTSVLVEIAGSDANHAPEVSYGTHFFLDLVEAHIIYLPVYPDDPIAGYNALFFEGSPNALQEFVPHAESYLDVVKVIDVPQAAKGRYLHVVADPQSQKAIAYLE